MLFGEEDLKRMKESKMKEKIAIFKCPHFCREDTNAVNLRTNSLKGDVKYDIEWGHLYYRDCQLCKTKNECKGICKHKNSCKLYVMNGEEGIVKIKRMNVNAKLLVRRMVGAAGYDLGAAESGVVPAHNK